MLILRRSAGETILIGDDVKITVMDVYEGGVRLAIDAPKSIPVLRSELLQAANANRDAAAKEPARPDELLGLLGSVPDDKKQKL
jgi:carbon storage regulator